MSVIQPSQIFHPEQSVDYASGAIVSNTPVRKTTGNISLFAFDQGQELSEHIASFDALVFLLDGEAEIIIDRKPYQLSRGEAIIMPAGIPHAVRATKRFKMMLVMIKS